MIRFRTVLYGSDVETVEAKDHFKKKDEGKNIIKRRIDHDFVVLIFSGTFMFFWHVIWGLNEIKNLNFFLFSETFFDRERDVRAEFFHGFTPTGGA